MNDKFATNPFKPWYGTENVETDAPIITCRSHLEPLRADFTVYDSGEMRRRKARQKRVFPIHRKSKTEPKGKK